MHVHYHPDIQVSLEAIRPIGDLVLVKRLPDAEETRGGLFIPETSRNEDRPKNPRNSIRRGVVVACGPGDKGILFECGNCGIQKFLTPSGKQYKGEDFMTHRVRGYCECGARDWQPLDTYVRREMHVSVGDIVFYQRWENNIVRLNNEEYTLLHEEGQVLAVEDAGAAICSDDGQRYSFRDLPRGSTITHIVTEAAA